MKDSADLHSDVLVSQKTVGYWLEKAVYCLQAEFVQN